MIDAIETGINILSLLMSAISLVVIVFISKVDKPNKRSDALGKFYLRAFLCFIWVALLSILLRGLELSNTLVNIGCAIGLLLLIGYPVYLLVKSIMKVVREVDEIEKQFKKLEDNE